MATSTGVTVGSSSTLALAANGARKRAILTNDSDEVIYLNLNGAAAEANKGIRLNASGGSVTIDNSDDNQTGYNNTTAIYAICASGSKNLCVHEE